MSGISRKRHPEHAAFVLAMREVFGEDCRVIKFDEFNQGDDDERTGRQRYQC